MSDLRDTLEHAKDAYKRLRYEGDLAADVFARLDAERAASMKIDRPATRVINWRAMLAIAAAVAVIATTTVTLTRTGHDPSPLNLVADNSVTPPVAVDPTPTKVATRTDKPAAVASSEAADFSVVPSYQSFAISVPTSLSLASVDEYDRQAQETKSTETTSTDAAKTVLQ